MRRDAMRCGRAETCLAELVDRRRNWTTGLLAWWQWTLASLSLWHVVESKKACGQKNERRDGGSVFGDQAEGKTGERLPSTPHLPQIEGSPHMHWSHLDVIYYYYYYTARTHFDQPDLSQFRGFRNPDRRQAKETPLISRCSVHSFMSTSIKMVQSRLGVRHMALVSDEPISQHVCSLQLRDTKTRSSIVQFPDLSKEL